MVERREDAGDVIRLGDIARPISTKADPLGGADHGTEERQRIEMQAVDRASGAQRCGRRRQPQQNGIEAAAFRRSRHRPERRHTCKARRTGHAPGGGMPAMRGEGSQEMHAMPRPSPC